MSGWEAGQGYNTNHSNCIQVTSKSLAQINMNKINVNYVNFPLYDICRISWLPLLKRPRII